MRSDNLTQNVNVRMDPALKAALFEAAALEDIAVGEFVRRAVRLELKDAAVQRLDPYAAIPSETKEAQLIEALRAMGDPEASQLLVEAVGDECVDVMDCVAQVLDVIHDPGAHQRFERAAGYLRQASENLLHAAHRVMAIRVHVGIMNGDLERIEARMRAAGEAR